jgi:hypothetical protein
MMAVYPAGKNVLIFKVTRLFADPLSKAGKHGVFKRKRLKYDGS